MRKLQVLSLILLCVIACERRTQVKLESGNPTTFMLSGSGRLYKLSIFDLKQAQGDKPIWEIVPEDGVGEKLEKLRVITYGIVPKGYKQIKPESGKSPPALVSGNRYAYYFSTVNAPGTEGLFEMHNGNAIAVEGSMPCYELVNGKKVPVECPE